MNFTEDPAPTFCRVELSQELKNNLHGLLWQCVASKGLFYEQVPPPLKKKQGRRRWGKEE
jgi:hypothetical protein